MVSLVLVNPSTILKSSSTNYLKNAVFSLILLLKNVIIL